MSKTMLPVVESYLAIRNELIDSTKIEGSDEPDTVAAILLLAEELRGTKNELSRIAQVLGAGVTAEGKIAQSDVPDNMLSLLAALGVDVQERIKNNKRDLGIESD